MIESTLTFLNEAKLNTPDFNENTEFLLPEFLAKRLITLIYADGGNGKSWFGFSLAKYCASIGQNLIYLDFDNPLSVLKERNINNLLVSPYSNLHYIQRSKCELQPQELLAQLSSQAVSKAYENCVFVIDSLRNFTNVNNDAQAMDTMTQLMNLREAGATILILHHSNKDGKNYQGSNNIRNSIDNMYQLQQLDSETGELRLHLSPKKERASIAAKAFAINAGTLKINEIDVAKATMSVEQEEFVQEVRAAIEVEQDINKTALLDAVGRKKDDKTARGWLDKFDGTYWQSKKAGGVFTYQLKAGASL